MKKRSAEEQTIGISRFLYRYEAKRPADTDLKEQLWKWRPKGRYGYHRLHVLL